jgi:hypothetical protein
MMEDLLVCCSSPPDFDKNVFMMWLEGKTIEEITRLIIELKNRELKSRSGSITSSSKEKETSNTLSNNNTPTINIDDSSTHISSNKNNDNNNNNNNNNDNNNILQTTKMFELRPRMPNSAAALYFQSQLTDLIRHEIGDQFRLFEILEHFFCQPLLLPSQVLVHIPTEIQSFAIEKYWSLDDTIIKEVIIRKSTKTRKDLDDITEATGFNIRRVTRQVNNIQRAFLSIEEGLKVDTKLPDIGKKKFGLNPLLSKKYAAILFLLFSKFNLTSKKRMSRIPCEVLELFAVLILGCLASDTNSFYDTFEQTPKRLAAASDENVLTFEGFDLYFPAALLTGDNDECWLVACAIFEKVETLDLDKQLLASLRDVRSILTGEILDHGCNYIKTELSERRGGSIKKGLDVGKIRTIVKALLQIGANLSQSREFRDIFEDLLSKVLEPLEELSLNSADIQLFLTCCNFVVKAIPISGKRNDSIFTSASSEKSLLDRDRGSPLDSAKLTGSKKALGKGDQLRKDLIRFFTCCKMCIVHIQQVR